jgi:hypothetical protein
MSTTKTMADLAAALAATPAEQRARWAACKQNNLLAVADRLSAARLAYDDACCAGAVPGQRAAARRELTAARRAYETVRAWATV